MQKVALTKKREPVIAPPAMKDVKDGDLSKSKTGIHPVRKRVNLEDVINKKGQAEMEKMIADLLMIILEQKFKTFWIWPIVVPRVS